MSTRKPEPQRIARKREAVRQRIIAAARVVAGRAGVGNLTIDAVAEQADVTKPSVYYYFASKDALIRALAYEECRAECRSVQEALAAALPGPAIVEAFVRAYVEHYANNLEMFRVGYVWSQLLGLDPAEVDSKINPDMKALLDALDARLTEEQRSGRLRPEIHIRRFVVTVWTSALGIVTTLSLLDAAQQKLFHDPSDLVTSLSAALCHGAFTDEAFP